MSSVSDIKLIRTDTTLDLSHKAEKRYRLLVPKGCRPPNIPLACGDDFPPRPRPAPTGRARPGPSISYVLFRVLDLPIPSLHFLSRKAWAGTRL